jgi:hypothetical protein
MFNPGSSLTRLSKKTLMIFVLSLFLASIPVPKSYALIVNDPILTAVNELQNSILQTEWAKDIALAIEHLSELKSQTLELLRFHSGFDEILSSIIGDPLRNLINQGSQSLRDAFVDLGVTTPQISIFEGASGPQDIRAALDQITGDIPDTDARPYLVFDEMQVTDAFDLAQKIRAAGMDTRSAANAITQQAAAASPKGAARLSVQAASQLMVINQQNQEALAKLIELEATQVAQEMRGEKQSETERAKVISDAGDFADVMSQAIGGA